jgi:hypothetical protein
MRSNFSGSTSTEPARRRLSLEHDGDRRDVLADADVDAAVGLRLNDPANPLPKAGA